MADDEYILPFRQLRLYLLPKKSTCPGKEFIQTLRAGGHAALGWTIFGVEWAACIAGVVFKAFTTGRYKYISTGAYIAMGWMAVVALPWLLHDLGGYGTNIKKQVEFFSVIKSVLPF